jgi:thiol-disulfide isomerase/thioredoxin
MSRATASLLVAAVLACMLPRQAPAQVVQISPEQAAMRVRYEKGPRVLLFYSYSCPYSRDMFPAFVSMARRYAAVGVTFLAFSLDDDPEILDAYLGSEILPFDRQMILPEGPGSTARAFAAEGIRVPAKTSTPSVVVYGEDDRMVGQESGTDSARRAEAWLRQMGFSAE